MAEYMSTLDYLEIDTEAVEEPLAASSSLGSSESTESCEEIEVDIPGSPWSLQQLAMQKTLHLLDVSFWSEEQWFLNRSRNGNPFVRLLPQVVNQMAFIILKSRQQYEIEHTIRPLVLTGFVEHFTMSVMSIYIDDLIPLINLLSNNSENLRNIDICKDFNYFEITSNWDDVMTELQHQITFLIRSSSRLERLVTDFEFDLEALHSCPNLRILAMYEFPSLVQSIVPHVHGLPDANAVKIEQLRIENKTNMAFVPPNCVGFLLTYLQNLTYLQWNIAEALELLHAKEWEEGTINKAYKLSKAYIIPKSRKQISIFAATCPEITKLNLSIDSFEIAKCLHPLRSLHKLHSLVLRKTRTLTLSAQFEFYEDLVPVLKVFRSTLRSLKVSFNVTNVDFGTLALFCPNLETLQIMLHSEHKRKTHSRVYFPDLKRLRIKFPDQPNFSGKKALSKNLIHLLSSCSKLQVVELHNAYHLEDYVLKEVLQKNGLRDVNYLEITDCNISEQCFRLLITSCKKLVAVAFTSLKWHATREELYAIVSSIDPDVVVN